MPRKNALAAADVTGGAANLFGKQEEEEEHAGSSFRFAQRDIDGFIKITTEVIAPTTFGMIWQLSAQECRGLLALCISDVNKLLLINSPGFTALLVMHPALLLSQICSPLHY